jgi:hypothetical protein
MKLHCGIKKGKEARRMEDNINNIRHLKSFKA